MLSKAKMKYVRSLEQKKFRRQEGAFVAEGTKTVGDLMSVVKPRLVVATRQWIDAQDALPPCELIEVSDEELRKVSFLQHPQQVLAVFPMEVSDKTAPSDGEELTSDEPDATALAARWDATALALALDGVQDPGNLGTIIRIADWFGIDTIYCSQDTADAFNPKVVQATMGSIARVHIIYCDLRQLLDTLPDDTPVYGTLLDGENIYRQPLTAHGLIVMGNEGKGISKDVADRVNRRLLIPNFPEGRETADSLNVAVATAITCAEFRRQNITTNV
ncbi:MAG: RNA methyltransferase [Prevotella sp.]|nr:RNA methyltransferase [Prevotella sp.]